MSYAHELIEVFQSVALGCLHEGHFYSIYIIKVKVTLYT